MPYICVGRIQTNKPREVNVLRSYVIVLSILDALIDFVFGKSDATHSVCSIQENVRCMKVYVAQI